MSRKASPTLIGGFMVGGITLAVVALMLFGSGPLFRKTYEFVLFFDGSVAGLREGAPVKFRGVEIGMVKRVYLDLPHIPDDFRSAAIPVVIELQEDRIRARGSRIDLDDPDAIDAVIDLGMRGQLQTESLLTGRLYIALDLHPGSPAVFVDAPGSPYTEIPTLPTTMQELQQKLTEFFAELDRIELDSIAVSAGELIEGLNQLANSPRLAEAVEGLATTLESSNETVIRLRQLAESLDARVTPLASKLEATQDEAGETMREARAALQSIRILLEPGSPLTYQLETTLKELSAAARAMQALVDYLERNPGSALRGRKITEENR
jgi:phospholipid/cholesterol/gamma-HCH transport system substrate-binding protein